jgi:hypothetical protein
MDNCAQSVLLKVDLRLTHCRGKAVADGAVSYYLDRLVSVRIARTTFGSKVNRRYKPSNPEHRRRASTVYTDIDDEQFVPNGFSVILAKVDHRLCVRTGFDSVHPRVAQGTRVTDTTKFSHSFYRTYSSTANLKSTTMRITAYRGENKNPQWTDVEPGKSFLRC